MFFLQGNIHSTNIIVSLTRFLGQNKSNYWRNVEVFRTFGSVLSVTDRPTDQWCGWSPLVLSPSPVKQGLESIAGLGLLAASRQQTQLLHAAVTAVSQFKWTCIFVSYVYRVPSFLAHGYYVLVLCRVWIWLDHSSLVCAVGMHVWSWYATHTHTNVQASGADAHG